MIKDDGIHTMAYFHKKVLQSVKKFKKVVIKTKRLKKIVIKKTVTKKKRLKKIAKRLHISNKMNSVVM